jgi:hypothetical protein
MIEADCSGNGAGSVLARSCPLARDDGTGTALHRPSPFSGPLFDPPQFSGSSPRLPCDRGPTLRTQLRLAPRGHHRTSARTNYPIHCGCFGSFHRFSAASIHRIVPAPGRGPRPIRGWPQNAVQGRLPGPLPEAESSCACDNAASQQTGSKALCIRLDCPALHCGLSAIPAARGTESLPHRAPWGPTRCRYSRCPHMAAIPRRFSRAGPSHQPLNVVRNDVKPRFFACHAIYSAQIWR